MQLTASGRARGKELIPPFAMYFTVEQTMRLSLTTETRHLLSSVSPRAELYHFWQQLTLEQQRELLDAHDAEYHYESVPN